MDEKKRNRILGLMIAVLLLMMAFGSYYVQNIHSKRVEQTQALRQKQGQQTRRTLENAHIDVKRVSDTQLQQINQRAKAEHQSVVDYVKAHPKVLEVR